MTSIILISLLVVATTQMPMTDKFLHCALLPTTCANLTAQCNTSCQLDIYNAQLIAKRNEVHQPLRSRTLIARFGHAPPNKRLTATRTLCITLPEPMLKCY